MKANTAATMTTTAATAATMTMIGPRPPFLAGCAAAGAGWPGAAGAA